MTVINSAFLVSLNQGNFVNNIVFDNVNLVVYALINNQYILSYNMYYAYSGSTQGYLTTSNQKGFFNNNIPSSVYMLGLQANTNTLFFASYFLTATNTTQTPASTATNPGALGILFGVSLSNSSTNTNNNTNTLYSGICFVGNTVVETDQGGIYIRDLVAGQHTLLGGKQIVGITRTYYTDKYLVKFSRDSLDLGIPSYETIITMDHKLFYGGRWVMARHFVDVFRGVELVPYPKGEILYNVISNKYDCMKVHNILVETLHPENLVARLYTTPWIAPYRDLLIFELNSCIDNYDPMTHRIVRRQLRQFMDTYGRIDERKIYERMKQKESQAATQVSTVAKSVIRRQDRKIFA